MARRVLLFESRGEAGPGPGSAITTTIVTSLAGKPRACKLPILAALGRLLRWHIFISSAAGRASGAVCSVGCGSVLLRRPFKRAS